MTYCCGILIEEKYPITANYEDKAFNGQKLHYMMYCHLRSCVRQHIAAGNLNPQLSLLAKPLEDKSHVGSRKKNIAGREMEFFGEHEDDISDSSSSDDSDSSDKEN